MVAPGASGRIVAGGSVLLLPAGAPSPPGTTTSRVIIPSHEGTFEEFVMVTADTGPLDKFSPETTVTVDELVDGSWTGDVPAPWLTLLPSDTELTVGDGSRGTWFLVKEGRGLNAEVKVDIRHFPLSLRIARAVKEERFNSPG